MKKVSRAIIVLCCLLAILCSAGSEVWAEKAFTVTSPDGNLAVIFELKARLQPFQPGERAYYRVTWKDVEVLSDSPLGLDFLGERPLDRDFEVIGTNRRSNDSTWENPFGAKRIVPDRYNEMTVSLRERQAPCRKVDLIFRAYDEGVAFRYFLPEQDALARFALVAENSGFYFPRDTSAFVLDMGRFNTHNEGEYLRAPLDEIKPSQIINLPVLAEIPEGP